MKIEQHRLTGSNHIATPNFDDRPDSTDISLLVIHCISLPPGEFGNHYIDKLFCNQLDPDEHPYFKDIYQPNIEIVNINYVMNIPIDISLQLEKISGCISSIFNVIEYNINKGIIMRFKRVANYNDMNSQDAFIVDKINLNYNEKDIIQDFSRVFK